MSKSQKSNYLHGGTQKDIYLEGDIEYVVCPGCNGNDYSFIDTERGLSVVECKTCGLLYTNPRSRSAEQNYFGDAKMFFNEASLIFSGEKRHHRDRNYLYEIKRIRKFKNEGRLLDIGTNMGFFLRKAKDFGYNVEGVEPSPALANIAVEQFGLKIHNCFLKDANLPESSFDIITLIDVFEHLTEPQQMLRKCWNLLKNDGILVIKVPNGNYNKLKMRLIRGNSKGSTYDIWDSYEHVVHYTSETLNNISKNNGFNVIKWFIPKPIHPPIWENLVGHYYQYPSPFILDWKKRIGRSLFYFIGKIERSLGMKVTFGPDIMFILEKSQLHD